MKNPITKSKVDTFNPILNPNSRGLPMQFSKLIASVNQAICPQARRGLAFAVCILTGVVLIFASSLNAQHNETQDEKTQTWQGVLDTGSSKLTLKFEIKELSKEYSAFAYSVDQGNARIPVDKVEVTASKMTLELSSIKGRFEGTFNEEGILCNGTWSQLGNDFDLVLKRLEPSNEQASKLVEYWKGILEPEEGVELEMGLKIFRMADGSLSAKLDSYSQGVTDLPVEFEMNGDVYQVKFPTAKLVYSGKLDKSKEKLIGTITQGRSKDELNFTKADFDSIPKKYNRPQTPQAPFPYDSVEVSYENSKQETKLAGTLTLPQGEGPFPVAITISGSGASDRDASHFDHKPFHVIADHMARRGIAVLRFDDRGRGNSTGDYTGATSADLATDAEAGIEFLKTHPKIDVGKIGMIGHSEGGMIAPMIAAERDDVHFIVLLAGTGVNGGAILKSQSTAMMKADGEPEEKLKANRDVHDAILSYYKRNPDATDEEVKVASKAFMDSIEDEETRKLMEPSAKQLAAILKSNWVQYFVKYEPAETLAKVSCHVLAMNGEKDLQVLCDLNLVPIEKALEEGSPASFEIVRLPNMNHMFQETNGTGTPEDYGTIEETFSPKALNLISDWVEKVTR